MKSIQREITRRLVLRVVLVFLLSGVAVFFFVSRELIRRFDLGIEAKGRALISVSEIEDDELEIDFIPGGDPLTAPDYFEVLDQHGHAVFQSHPDAGRLATSSIDRDAANSSFDSIALPGGLSGRIALVPFRPIDDNTGRPSDQHFAVVASDSRELDRSIALLGIALLVATAVAVFAILPIMRSSLSAGLLPLLRLARETESLGPKDLAHRFSAVDAPRELAPVIGRLNDLLARLDDSFERERRFSSNASHELRAPIAEIRAIADLALRWPEEANGEQFEQIRAITVDMQRLVEHLVILARADSGSQPVERTTFRFSALLDECLERVSAEIQRKNLKTIQDVVPGDWCSDPIIWKLVVSNLVENAVHHSQPGSEIHIAAVPGNLTISNPAPNLTAADESQLTERFWRKDDRRSEIGHCGLGLALVKVMVETIGAKFSVTRDPETQRLRVSVTETGR